MIPATEDLEEATQVFEALASVPENEHCWIFQTPDGQFFPYAGRDGMQMFAGFAMPILYVNTRLMRDKLDHIYLDNQQLTDMMPDRMRIQ